MTEQEQASQEQATNTDQRTEQNDQVQAPTPNDVSDNRQGEGDDPRITKLNRESARYRTERNELREQLEQLTQERQAEQERWQKLQAALGMGEDESPEDKLKAVQETADKRQAELEKTQAELRDLRTRQEIASAARKHGADGDLITDILAGRGALSKLDHTADDYAFQVEDLVKETVNAHPSLTTPRVAASSGNAPTPTQNEAGKLSRDDLASMTPEQINQAVKDGKLDHILTKEA